LRALDAYAWPGNVRELSHVIERAVLMLDSDVVDEAALNLRPEATHALAGAAALAASESMSVDAAEERLVREALERTGGNIQRAAGLLGLSRPSLYRRMEKYGIE
jgi:DNA-binding NtrC family response regulator